MAVAPGHRFKSFSIGFEEPSYSEEPFARAVAEHLGTEHHQFTFTAADAAALLPRLGSLLDEPLADPAFLPTLHLARHTRASVTVALSGDGGDELLCGYPTFLAVAPMRWMRRLPAAAVAATERLVDALPSSSRYGSPGFLLKQFFRGAAHSPDVATQIMMGGLALGRAAAAPLARRSARPAPRSIPTTTSPRSWPARRPDDPISRLIYHHCKLYLAGQTLVKMDRGTMAYGVEARAPFLDPDLVELACAMPSAMKLRGWTTKYALKRALAGRLPREILTRRKQGFGVPIAQWLRGPLRPLLEETLDPARVRRIGLLDPGAASRRLVTEHVAGQRDHRKVLWSLLVFELWREAYLPGAPGPDPRLLLEQAGLKDEDQTCRCPGGTRHWPRALFRNHSPRNWGGRFSSMARTPSRASALLRARAIIGSRSPCSMPSRPEIARWMTAFMPASESGAFWAMTRARRVGRRFQIGGGHHLVDQADLVGPAGRRPAGR